MRRKNVCGTYKSYNFSLAALSDGQRWGEKRHDGAGGRIDIPSKELERGQQDAGGRVAPDGRHYFWYNLSIYRIYFFEYIIYIDVSSTNVWGSVL